MNNKLKTNSHRIPTFSVIVPSTFLHPLKGSKNSIYLFFFFFVFETPLKDFPFYSPILLTLWFRCLQPRIRESCMYLPGKPFSKLLHETLKLQENSVNAVYSDLQT